MMKFRSRLFLAWKYIQRNLFRSFLDVFGLCVALFFLAVALFIALEIRPPLIEEIGRAFPEDRLIIKPKTIDLSIVKLNRTRLTSDILEKVKKIPAVNKVYPIQPLMIPVRAEGSIFGQQLSTDVVVTGAPVSLASEDLASDAEFHHAQGSAEDPLPVVISRYFLDLYNLGVAESNNLPKFSEQSAVGRTFDLILGESTISGRLFEENSRTIVCRVAGFTPDVSLMGIVIPLESVEKFHNWYFDEEVKDYTLAYVQVSNLNEIDRVTQELRGLGLAVESRKDVHDRFQFLIDVVSAGVFLFAGGIFLIAVSGMAYSETLSLIERKQEMGLLMAAGADKKSVKRIFRLEKNITGATAGIAASAIFSGLIIAVNRFAGEYLQQLTIASSILEKIDFPWWIPITIILFSAFFFAPVTRTLLSRYLKTPAARLLKQ